MSAHPPPVPPEQRPHSGHDPAAEQGEAKPAAKKHPANPNPDERGRQGNLRQNTHNQGYQQDR